MAEISSITQILLKRAIAGEAALVEKQALSQADRIRIMQDPNVSEAEARAALHNRPYQIERIRIMQDPNVSEAEARAALHNRLHQKAPTAPGAPNATGVSAPAATAKAPNRPGASVVAVPAATAKAPNRPGASVVAVPSLTSEVSTAPATGVAAPAQQPQSREGFLAGIRNHPWLTAGAAAALLGGLMRDAKYRNLSNALFGLGAVGGAVGVGSAISRWWRSRKKEHAVNAKDSPDYGADWKIALTGPNQRGMRLLQRQQMKADKTHAAATRYAPVAAPHMLAWSPTMGPNGGPRMAVYVKRPGDTGVHPTVFDARGLVTSPGYMPVEALKRYNADRRKYLEQSGQRAVGAAGRRAAVTPAAYLGSLASGYAGRPVRPSQPRSVVREVANSVRSYVRDLVNAYKATAAKSKPTVAMPVARGIADSAKAYARALANAYKATAAKSRPMGVTGQALPPRKPLSMGPYA